MKTITLIDPQGKDVSVPQEQVVPLLRSGFGVRRGQTVTLADKANTEIPVERLVEVMKTSEYDPNIETSRSVFQRGAEERFGGGAGLAAGLGYGALQGATMGLGGKALIESGLVKPETLAQLEEARGGGLFSTVGAGEALGLGAATALTGGAAAAEAGAARTLGQQVLRSAGREALMGAGYGAGSEITQAAIEGREARPLEAAQMGAVLGGTLGAAVPVLSKAAEKARGLAAKSEARSLATPEGRAAVDAQTEFDARLDTLREEATTKAQTLRGIATSWNETIEKSRGMGFATPEAGISRVSSQLEKLSKDLANAERTLGDARSLESFEKDLSSTIREGLKNKTSLATAEASLRQELGILKDKLEGATMKAGNERAAASVQGRIDLIEKSLAHIDQGKAAYEELGKIGTTLQGYASAEAEKLSAKFKAVKQADAYRRTLAKLEGTGEEAATLAGAEASAARAEAGRASNFADRRTLEQIQLKEQLDALGIQSSARHRHLILKAVEMGEADPAAFQQFVKDVVSIERGEATMPRVTKGGNVRQVNASAFSEVFRHPQVLERLSAENKAYIHAIADTAKETQMLRAAARGGVATRIPGIAEELASTPFSVGGDLYKAIRGQAVTDMVDPAVRGASLADAMTIGEKYRLVSRAEQAATEVAPKAPGEAVTSKNITAATPEQTAQLRTNLATVEKAIEDIDGDLKTLRDKKAQTLRERISIQKGIVDAKREARRGTLLERKAKLDAQLERQNKFIDETTATRDAIGNVKETLRTNRSMSEAEAAQYQESLANARRSIAENKRALKSGELERKVQDLTTEAGRKIAAKAELQMLRDQHAEAARALDNLTATGDRRLMKAAAQSGRIIPLDELRIFERSVQAFKASPEGKELLREIAKASKPLAEKLLEPENLLAGLGSAATGYGVLSGGIGTTLVGVAMAAMSGKKGLYKAASTFMNPVRFWTATGNAMKALERTTPVVSRTSSTTSGYTFSVPEANAFVSSILADREAADDAFRKLSASGAIDARNYEEARRRFNDTIDYLERKRPMTTNGANAQDFARAVALVKNPDLLAKFVADNGLRQQDVDIMKRVSPESYESLKGAVEALHRTNPVSVANLAPLFKILTKTSYAMRTTLPLPMLQQISGSSMTFQQPMQPKDEVMKERASVATASSPSAKSAIASSRALGAPSATR